MQILTAKSGSPPSMRALMAKLIKVGPCPDTVLEFLKKGDGRDNYKNTTLVKIIGWARSGEICVLSLYGIQYMLPP